jgi:hypothetical protein
MDEDSPVGLVATLHGGVYIRLHALLAGAGVDFHGLTPPELHAAWAVALNDELVSIGEQPIHVRGALACAWENPPAEA